MKSDIDLRAFVRKGLGLFVGVDTGPSSNTPVSTLHRGSEDRLAVACYCMFGPRAMSVAKVLDEAKLVAQKSSEGLADVVIGGEAFQVRATGYRAKDGGPYFRYVLVFQGCSILWTGKSEFKKDLCNVQVHLGSLFCMSLGADQAWVRMCAALKALDAVVARSALSRVDIAVDLVGVAVAEFMEFYHRRQYVSRGVVRDTYKAQTDAEKRELVEEFRRSLEDGNWDCRAFGRGRNDTGFMIGKSLQIAVYDKAREVVRDELKKQWLVENRWGGEMPGAATRVEFRLSRVPLRNFGIVTVEDWLKRRGNVLSYLVDEWFWLTDGDHDRRHTERATVAPVWVQVQDAFKAMYSAAADVVLKKVKRGSLECHTLIDQVMGCLGSVIARKYGDLSGDIEGLKEVVCHELEMLSLISNGEEFRDALSRKASRFASEVPPCAAVVPCREVLSDVC